MKKYLRFLTLFLLCFTMTMGQYATAKAAGLSITYSGQTYDYTNKQLSVVCGGKKVDLKKTPGILEDGYGLLPYDVFQNSSLGVTVTYASKKKTITYQYAKQKVVLTLNSNVMKVNGKSQKMPIVPKLVRYNAAKVTKPLVPSRNVAEALDLDYSYDSKTATISMKQKKGMNVTVPEDTKSGLSITYNGKTYDYNGKQLSVICGGESVDLKKNPGILEDGYALLPYTVFQQEGLDVKATYQPKKKTLTFQYGKQKVVVTLNSNTMKVNSSTKTLPVTPKLVKYNDTGVTKPLVPSRSVAEALGLDYYYDSKTATISIGQKSNNQSGSENNSSDKNDQSSETTGRKVKYDGKVVTITKRDVTIKTEGVIVKTAMPGIILNNTSMLPAYNTFNKNKYLGSTYKYDAKKQQVTITGNGNKIVLTLGKKTALLNGKSISLAEPAWLMTNLENNKNYCMIPGQSVAEALGYVYIWDNSNVVSMINKSDNSKEPTEDETTEEPTTEEPTTEEPTTEEPTTEQPSTGDQNSSKPSDLKEFDISIPRPSSKVKWSDCEVEDDYHNRRFIITLPANYSSFYNKNKISYNTSGLVQSVVVTADSKQNTQIIITTKIIQALAYKETADSWMLGIKDPTDLYDKVIVLDAGHGGSDTGSTSSKYGVIEKNVALNIIKKTQKYFANDSDLKVYYTRLEDSQNGITYGDGVSTTTVSVINRAQFANDIAADLFISVHCNSVDYESARGTEVLYSSKNTAVTESGLTSKKFADLAFPYLLNAVGSTKRSVKDSPNLIVCKSTKMPAILLETAFLSNKQDADILKDENKLDDIAKSIYDMVHSAFDQYPADR